MGSGRPGIDLVRVRAFCRELHCRLLEGQVLSFGGDESGLVLPLRAEQ